MNMSDGTGEIEKLLAEVARLKDQIPGTFLSGEEVATLTGRRVRAMQIEALKNMMIPFWVNAIGKPVVSRAAINGHAGAPAVQQKKQWSPPE